MLLLLIVPGGCQVYCEAPVADNLAFLKAQSISLDLLADTIGKGLTVTITVKVLSKLQVVSVIVTV